MCVSNRQRCQIRTSCPALLAAIQAIIFAGGCLSTPPSDNNGGAFANSTDKTNGNAAFIGSSACRQCHAQISDQQIIHGHANILSKIQGEAPQFPSAADRAGVPNPPDGYAWVDVSYVVGGYIKAAFFLDQGGYILTTGLTGRNTQWNLQFTPNGSAPGFAPYEPGQTVPKSYDFSCFACHTTGPRPQTAQLQEFQDNRPGLAGTWSEAGMQCEACHGPGSKHFTTVGGQVAIHRDRIFVDSTGADTCVRCHSGPFGSGDGVIQATDGFIEHSEQSDELAASGAHSAFKCTICHDPHRSTVYNRTEGIRNECVACHATQSMAGHEGKLFARGDYVESLSCTSCHMPFATKTATSSLVDLVDEQSGRKTGAQARIGDTRTHIFRISTAPAGFSSFFSDDGLSVRRDANGLASISVDFVCLRCHNGTGSSQGRTLFHLSVDRAAEIAIHVHELP